MERSWKKVGEMETDDGLMDIIRHENEGAFMLGRLQPTKVPSKDNVNKDKLVFGVVFSIRISATRNHSFRDKGATLGYSNVYSVDGVGVMPDFRGQGIAKKMYKWLIRYGITILGDREQYFGARRLWAILSRDTDVIVDVVDYQNLTVIARDVRLHQGRYDEDFDKAIWSYDDSKENIRLVLRDVL